MAATRVAVFQQRGADKVRYYKIHFIIVMDATAKIRELNDAFRTSFRGNGDVFLTAGIAALPEEEQAEILRRVQSRKADPTPSSPISRRA